MDLPTLAVFHTVEFLGFYLPPLTLWAGGALIPFAVLRWTVQQFGLYRFVWHRSLFNLALYVLLMGGVVFFGNLRMALIGIARIQVSLVAVAAAVVVGWWLWDFYTLSPWTRDARVQANIVEVAPDVSGLIAAIDVVDNQKVAKGDVLYVIDQKRFVLAVEEAQANVAQSRATLKLARDDADRNATVMEHDWGAISAQVAETSRAKASEATAALQLAQAQLATANSIWRSRTSPVNGFVTNLTATVGDYATRGTGVLALVDSDSFYVYAYFMETKLPAIKIGGEAEVRLMAGASCCAALCKD